MRFGSQMVAGFLVFAGMAWGIIAGASLGGYLYETADPRLGVGAGVTIAIAVIASGLVGLVNISARGEA